MNSIVSYIFARRYQVGAWTAAHSRYAAAVAALLFGALLVYGAGFAGSEVLHNAAHDGRHAFAFPCH